MSDGPSRHPDRSDTSALATAALAPAHLDDAPDTSHLVRFYEHDRCLVEEMARFVGGALGAGDAAVVVATGAHLEDLEEVLHTRGLDLAVAREEGRYFVFDPTEMLPLFMVDGHPDETRFGEVVASTIIRAADGGRRVYAFGEMVNVLWAEGQQEAALELEALWNALARKMPFTLLCAYPMSSFGSEADGAPFLKVCAEHSAVIPAESYSSLMTPDERLRAISRLQQKARALETEVAQRKETESARQKALDELQAANQAKDEFLAMLGHELRNPLAAVQNAVVTARLDSTRRDRALDIARRGVDQLRRLVDDLLDVARITQGRITLRTQRLPLASIIERAVEAARSLIDDRAHAVVLSLPGDEVQVEGDSTRLEQVVANLLTNAAKYTNPGGQITLTAALEGAEAVLRIRDNGIGIAAEMLPRVFNLFAQADRALDRAQGGLGIGLTVVKRMVELHGGRVEAHSNGLGTGAEFVVRLPAALAARDDAAQTAATDGPRRTCARVLLVEDNPDTAEGMRMLLDLLGHRVRAVQDGPSALEAARAMLPDVMLVDIGLPGMDGYELARRVRQDPALRHVILVALTGYGREEDRLRALRAGFNHHLVKPVNPDALQGLVAQLSPPELRAKRPLVH